MQYVYWVSFRFQDIANTVYGSAELKSNFKIKTQDDLKPFTDWIRSEYKLPAYTNILILGFSFMRKEEE